PQVGRVPARGIAGGSLIEFTPRDDLVLPIYLVGNRPTRYREVVLTSLPPKDLCFTNTLTPFMNLQLCCPGRTSALSKRDVFFTARGSGRKHKAWGEAQRNPRLMVQKQCQPAVAGD